MNDDYIKQNIISRHFFLFFNFIWCKDKKRIFSFRFWYNEKDIVSMTLKMNLCLNKSQIYVIGVFFLCIWLFKLWF